MEKCMDVTPYLEQGMPVEEQFEEEPLDSMVKDATKRARRLTLNDVTEETAPDAFMHELRAVPEPPQIDDAERAQAVLVHEPEDRTLTEGSKTTSSVHPPVVPQQHPGCLQCRHFLQEHPDFLSKLRECASRNAHLIPDLMALLDNFENLRLGHVELIHRPHNGRYAELFRYFKNATTVVMSDRYAVKEEWQLEDFVQFCAALVEGCLCPNLRRIVVLTPQANFLAPTRRGEPAPTEVFERIKANWDELTERLSTKHNVTLEYMDFDLHLRKFLSDDGKSIESDRGIHFDAQKYDTDKRGNATTFVYYRTRPDDPIPPPARKRLKPSSPKILETALVSEALSSATTADKADVMGGESRVEDTSYEPCRKGAKRCSYAHPFCSDGVPCKCDPDKRDLQLNHLVPKATHLEAI